MKVPLFRPATLTVAAVVTLLVGCAGNPAKPTATDLALAGDPDLYLIVDCLLPPQVRRLGTKAVFLTARRAVKTSAGDCGRRGGEYVAYDRASYRNALQVWLPDAQQGDPEAQTYVGEIYEKGVAGGPDYGEALKWYRLAAAQGFARAQNHLGQLYERGLGVPADKTAALNWYRKAIGLNDDDIVFGTSLQELESRIAEQDQTIGELRREVDRLRGSLRNKNSNLQQGRRELEQARRQLAAARAARDRQPLAAAIKPTADLAALERQVAAGEAKLDSLSVEKTRIEARAELLEAKLGSERQDKADLLAKIDELERQLRATADRQQAEREASLAELEQERRVLADARAELRATENRLREQQIELAARDNTAIRELGNQVLQLEREAAGKQQLIEQLEAELLRGEQTALNRQLAEQRANLDRLAGQLAAAEAALSRHKAAIEAQESSEIAALKARLANQQAALAEAQRRNETVERELDEANRKLQQTQVNFQVLEEERELVVRSPRPPVPQSGGGGNLPSAPSMDFGSYYALVIGNNRYAKFDNLSTAVNDARDVAQVLRQRYGFEVQVLTDATRLEILSALNGFRNRLTNKDNFLLYYAGHGYLDERNERGHWLPSDADGNDQSNWILNEQITDAINTIEAKHVMVIADSCYSGTLARTVTTSIDGDGSRTPEQQRRWLELMIQTRSRTVLTSGGLSPVLDGGGGRNSVFAKNLLAVLRGNNQVLEGPILFQQVLPRVERDAARLGVTQSPQYAPLRFAGDVGAPFFLRPIN